jgi:membrane protein DedA with SNARE-associated domain
MFFSFANIISWMLTYSYFILFPLVVIEGPIISILAGFIASMGHLHLIVAYIVIIIADLVGDTMYYYIGYSGRKTFVKKWGKYIGINEKRVESIENHFKKHSVKTLVAGKLSQGVGAVILVAAGISKMPFREFIWYNLLATLPKSLILLLVGYYFGRAYVEFNDYLSYTTFIMIGLAAMLLVIYFVIRKVAKKYE